MTCTGSVENSGVMNAGHGIFKTTKEILKVSFEDLFSNYMSVSLCGYVYTNAGADRNHTIP